MTYYECLGVQPNATLQEIKKAYRRLVKHTHPDKVVNKTAQFLAIQAAFETLREPDKRRLYDQSLANTATIDFNKNYCLLSQPNAVNHYEFINLLFMTAPDSKNYLIPGQPLSDCDKNCLWHELHHVASKLHNEQERLKQQYQPTLTAQQQLNLLSCNENKIKQVMSILTTGDEEQLLYDLSLGNELVQQTPDMLIIDQLIGGRIPLINHIAKYPSIHTAKTIFALHMAGCLNPINFDRLTAHPQAIEHGVLCRLLMILFTANLLNQRNFDLVLTRKKQISTLCNGLDNLQQAGLLNQTSFQHLLTYDGYAESVGSALKQLKTYNLLNDINQHTIYQLAQSTRIGIALGNAIIKLQKHHAFIPEDGLVLQWMGDSADLHNLSQCIDKLFAHGLVLLSCDEEKALPVFLLALQLKKSLKTFFEQSQDEQIAQRWDFKAHFLHLLHSQDNELSKHRSQWKVIVANVALAFTGIGLFMIGAYYWHTGHYFFHQTQREILRDTIQQSTWLQEEPNNLETDIVMC